MANAKVKVNIIPGYQPMNVMPARQAIPRGVILSGVLNGTASYEAIRVVTDASGVDDTTQIEYDPNADQRLDRFDALEMGYEAMDAPDSSPDTPTGSETSSK